MPKTSQEAKELTAHEKGKNIKNIYIQKISSLIKLSNEQISVQNIQMPSLSIQKKIRKTHSDGKINLSEVDKNNLKLQKNRQSAKKARKRKKIYVQLLEQQVQILRNELLECKEVEKQSEKYLALLNKKINKIHQQCEFNDVDKYFSQENMLEFRNEQILEEEDRQVKMDLHIKELQQFILPTLVKNTQSDIQNKKKQKSQSEERQAKEDLVQRFQQEKKLFEKYLLPYERTAREMEEINRQIVSLINEVIWEENSEIEKPQLKEKISSLLELLNICESEEERMQLVEDILEEKFEKKAYIKTEQVERMVVDLDNFVSKKST